MPSQTASPPSIAVIAVHGVADQKPGESARAITRMLLGLRRGLQAHFTSFRELGLSLPNRRVGIEMTSPEHYRAMGSDVRPRFIRASQGSAVDDVDYRFMRELLSDYRQGRGDDVYQTIRLEGTILADEERGHGKASVHVYEAYWADLSRVSDRLYRIIGEFYQLILHLPFLGLQAIDFRRHARDNQSVRWWSHHRWAYGVCLWIFTLPLPILNILLLVIGLSVIPEKIPEAWHARVAVALAGALAAILGGIRSLRRRAVKNPWSWLWNVAITALVMLVTALLVGLWTSGHGKSLYLQLGFVSWLGFGGLLLPVLRSYDRHRPGIRSLAIALYVAITPAFVVALRQESNSVEGLRNAMLRTLELTFCLLWLCWLALAVVTTWYLLSGWATRMINSSFRAGSSNSRALFTGMLALTMSISIFSQITILLWAGLLETIAPILVPNDVHFTPLIFKDLTVPPEKMTVRLFLDTLLNANGPPIFVGGIILTAIVAVIVIWAMWPSVWTELRPVRPSSDESSATHAERQGYWLSSGFRLMRVAGELVAFGVLVAAGFALYTLWRRLSGHAPHWTGAFGLTPEMLFGLGAITGTVAGLFALGRLADELALGFRPALDVLLDVDNYLRAQPRERTPRARIAERYTTLLRYLCRWENRSAGSTGGRYDAVVIVAHSQGSIITADLLRFLQCERGKNPGFEPDLDRLLGDSSGEGHLPVYFFTMGCPLRQLYRLRFPDLYRWVAPPESSGGTDPDPDTLGVTRWVNVYRSGDYVGRNLWTPDTDPHLFTPDARPRTIDAARSEGCIGAGAHTHYWDDTAPMVAVELDQLIVDAIASAAARPRA